MDRIPLPTWECESCKYKQDYEPTAENHAIHFPGLGANMCPACKGTLRSVKSSIFVNIATPDEIEKYVADLAATAVTHELRAAAQTEVLLEEAASPTRFSEGEIRRRIDAKVAKVDATKKIAEKRNGLSDLKANLLRQREADLSKYKKK